MILLLFRFDFVIAKNCFAILPYSDIIPYDSLKNIKLLQIQATHINSCNAFP